MYSKQFLIRFPNNNIISRDREIAEKEEDEDMYDTAHSWGNFHGTLRAERDGKRKDMKSHSGKNGSIHKISDCPVIQLYVQL